MKTVAEYNDRFWNFLRGLQIYDAEEWPSDVPQQTTDSHWTFCFNGEPIFPIALTPAHDKRRSRYASNLLIAMQPKWVIDNLMSGGDLRQVRCEIYSKTMMTSRSVLICRIMEIRGRVRVGG